MWSSIAPGFSSGDALTLMEQVSAAALPTGAATEWSAMSYQEKQVGNQLVYTFALAILLVYLVLAGQYESWYAPITVVLSVPLSLLGPASVLTFAGLDNNLYIQIGLILLIGHNPGLQELAEDLMTEASGPSSTLSRIRSGFPTAAAVAFAFDANGRASFDGFFQPDVAG
jgi:HAE1 family hydrophobic/amphiphilic exporter-1